MSEDKLARAKQLIEQKRYEEAKAILLEVADDPTARQWIEKLDEIMGHVEISEEGVSISSRRRKGGGLGELGQAVGLGSSADSANDEPHDHNEGGSALVWDCDLCNTARIPADQTNCPNCGAPQTQLYSPAEREGDARIGQELGKTYEMLWDCEFCGTEKLLGKTHRYCPNCGAPQNPEKRYFPSDEEKVAVEDHVYHGADVICPACETPNSAAANNCVNCGSPLSEADRADTLGEQRRGTGEQFQSSGPRNPAEERFNRQQAAIAAQEAAAAADRNKKIIIGVILAVIAAIIGIGIFVSNAKSARDVYVSGHTWERSIDVEEFGPQSKSDWCDRMPARAYNVDRRREVRDYEKVPDGEECEIVRRDNGDGTFSEREECETKYREEPIYDDKCYYKIDEWAFAYKLDSSGSGLEDAPYWPEADFACTTARVGCEREGGRSEHYTVALTHSESGDVYKCGYDYERWANLAPESSWTLEVNDVTGHVYCESLAAPE